MIADIRAQAENLGDPSGAEVLVTANVNSTEVESFLKGHGPDIIFVNCISQLISPRICEIPKLGTFIYHEGLTPEYRGQHTVFWALANGDDDRIGYTLLRANKQLDGGEVYAQGRTRLEPLASPMGYTGHWALFEGLPDVAQVLSQLEENRIQPIDTTSRKDAYYSYFPYSQLQHIRRRRRERNLPISPKTPIHRPQP